MAMLWGVDRSSSVSALEASTPGTALQLAGAAMEGKETRFGEAASSLFAASTTGTSTGAVNSFHSSFTALGGGLLIFNMGLGEVAPGGVGSGLYGMLVLAIVTVFVAGLMVGRTPEYLRKKITSREIKLVSLYILTMPVIVLARTGLAMALPGPRESILNPGPHGLSEVLYAFMSGGNNNGSAFAGLSANTAFYNTALGLAMLAGRFVPIVLVLALAGSLARQQPVPATAGHAADAPPALRRHARRRRRHRRRPDLLPRARPRSAGGGPVMPRHLPPVHQLRTPRRNPPRDHPESQRRRECRPACSTPRCSSPPSPPRCASSTRGSWSAAPSCSSSRSAPSSRRSLADRRPQPLRLVGRGVAVAHRRSSPTSPRRSPRAAARPRRPPCGGPRPRPMARRLRADGSEETVPGPELRAGRPGRGRGRRDHPRRRRRRRGRGERRRVGDHRRVRAGHPGVRWRPQLGHRRHQGPLRPHRGRASPRSRARASSTG